MNSTTSMPSGVTSKPIISRTRPSPIVVALNAETRPRSVGRPETLRLVLLRHEPISLLTFSLAAVQQGQRGKRLMSATAMRLCMLAMEFGTWRSGRIGGASGLITCGKSRFFEPRGAGRS